MTRKEQIEDASRFENIPQFGEHEIPEFVKDALECCFQLGAQWADEHPMDEWISEPITEQILDKNFKDIAEPHQMIYGGRWVYYDEYFEVEITEYTDGLWQVQVDEIEMSGLPTWRMYVSNVHELQQALRLANVKKEII